MLSNNEQAGPSVVSLTQLTNSQKTDVGSDEFATLAAPMLVHDEDALLNNFILQGPSGDFCGDMKPRDPVEEFLNETIADPDEHSSTTSKVQYDSDTGVMPTEFDNWVVQVIFASVCCICYNYCSHSYIYILLCRVIC
jgi:hypothetical protein